MREHSIEAEVAVIGGGMSGVCAALAAARSGARTVLIQDRPVLGGNASSEIRVSVHGAAQFNAWARETGIIGELLTEERARNHEEINENGWTNSVFDLVLYDTVQRQEHLELHVNTSLIGCELDGDRIACVRCRVANAETELNLTAACWIDCTGDGLLADLAGCDWRMGTESRDEFDEPHAPVEASADTMGNSIHIRCRDTGRDCPFMLPDWAQPLHDHDYFYQQGRPPNDPRGGFWWIEIGMPWHTIHDNEAIRHELTRYALGVWDWMKNRDPVMRERTKTFALEWIGQVPGKRESRRIRGLTLLTEQDILQRRAWSDEIAYGGWFVDLHTPGGLLADSSEPMAAQNYARTGDYAAKCYVTPYALPLSICIAADRANLFMAGRNVSVTHAALGTMRVMATCGLLGQGVGTAAAHAARRGVAARDLAEADVAAIQQRLLLDGAFLLHTANADPDDLARHATLTVSSEARFHGITPHEPRCDNGLGRWEVSEGGRLGRRLGTLLPVDGGPVEAVELCLHNEGDEAVRLPLALQAVPDIWDQRVDAAQVLAQGSVSVPPGGEHWLRWDCRAQPAAPGWLRLDAWGAPSLRWLPGNRLLPGCAAVWEHAEGALRMYGDGIPLAARIAPEQAVYGAAQLATGFNRPYRGTGCWRSDPGQALPQWCELHWDEPVTLVELQAIFAGQLAREYHAHPPFYREPQCVRDAIWQVPDGTGWREIARIAGNHQRVHRSRLAAPVTTGRLRLLVTASNGDPSAIVYELRCYGA